MDPENADEAEELREQAREQVEDLPAETALGNTDPQGGGVGTAKEYDEHHTSTTQR